MHLEVKFKTGETREIELSSTHTIEVKGHVPADPSDPGTLDSFSMDGVDSIKLIGGKPEPVAPPAPVGPSKETFVPPAR